jgi:hypothetical protein
MNAKRWSNRLVPLIFGVTAAGLSFPALAFDAVITIPEPGTMALILGGIGAGVLVWRNRKK